MNTETPTMYKPHTGSDRISLKPLGYSEPPRPHTHAKLDRLGMWFSIICPIHCLVMSIVGISFPVISWINWGSKLDVIALSIGAVFGLGGCLLSLRQHRDLRPLCLVVAGLALNAVGRFARLQLGPHLSLILIVDGPLLMDYGLWKDRRLCKCTGHPH
jgi:hypothetical protein